MAMTMHIPTTTPKRVTAPTTTPRALGIFMCMPRRG